MYRPLDNTVCSMKGPERPPILQATASREYVLSYRQSDIPVECISITSTFFSILYMSLALTIAYTNIIVRSWTQTTEFVFYLFRYTPMLFMCSLYTDDARGSDWIALSERMICDCLVAK
jgi:hypothetical protein